MNERATPATRGAMQATGPRVENFRGSDGCWQTTHDGNLTHMASNALRCNDIAERRIRALQRPAPDAANIEGES